MARYVSFAGKPWYVIGIHIEGNYSYLRAVNPIKILNDSDTNWKDSSVRKYLNVNFFKTFPEEMRKRIIMVFNRGNTIDSVWLMNSGNDREFRYMDNTMPLDTADEVYPCICVNEEEYKDKQFLVDELSCLYENGSIKNIDSEFEKLLKDAEPVIQTPFQMFMFMWYNSNDDLRKELEQMFEIMTAFPFEEFIKEKYDNRLDVVRANENERIFSYRGYEFYIGYSQYQTKGFINFGVAHTKYNKPREYNTRATSTSIDCIRWAITKLAEDVLLEIGIGKRYIGDFVTVIEDQFAKLLNSKYKGVTNYE